MEYIMTLGTTLFLPFLIFGWLLIFLPLLIFALAPLLILMWSSMKVSQRAYGYSRILLRKSYNRVLDRPFFYPYEYNMTLYNKDLMACSCIGKSKNKRRKKAILTVHQGGKDYFKTRKYLDWVPSRSILKNQINDARNFISSAQETAVGWHQGIPLKCLICPIRSEAIIQRNQALPISTTSPLQGSDYYNVGGYYDDRY